ncbi:uncharacterized protein LOC132732118 [Ruditapes philippinarum]|uniref:uncharacterized protein LOC132732118 n=1 Tax=Ruditapes philippinarum TaxID=129788 RepID=UPI00295B285E|nr:uncharacterized protein LOC132732118 [Ruditapes philippinarum]
MSTFISIKDNAWQFRNTNFSKYDLLAVLSVAPKYIRKGIDEFEAARLLHCHAHISQEDISDGDRQSAQELMCTLQRSTSGRERRREMVNSLCKARIHEVDDINLAQTYAEEARKFALEGSHFPADLENITRYKSFLNTNTHVKQKT